MSKLKTLARRAAIVVAVGGAAAGLVASPASAAASLVLTPAISTPTAGTYNVAVNCNAGPGVTTNLNQITYTVYGTASAYSTNGTVAVATGVTCSIKDATTGVTYGTISNALPGPEAAVVGTITVPFNSNPKLCGRGNALFNNNATAARSTC